MNTRPNDLAVSTPSVFCSDLIPHNSGVISGGYGDGDFV